MGEIYEQLEYTPYGELWVEHVPVVETTPFRFTGKERDGETGLYYFGARYLNPQTSMWLSADPAMGEYIPQAPVNDEAKKYNQNLPGMGGVFNHVNLHAYHYAGNNPVVLKDPDGNFLINNILSVYRDAKGERWDARKYAVNYPNSMKQIIGQNRMLGQDRRTNQITAIETFLFANLKIKFENQLEVTLNYIVKSRDEKTKLLKFYSSVKASTQDLGNGIVAITVEASFTTYDYNGKLVSSGTNSAVVAFATDEEVAYYGKDNIANRVLAVANIDLKVE
jgi:RHS repeat-associated protein